MSYRQYFQAKDKGEVERSTLVAASGFIKSISQNLESTLEPVDIYAALEKSLALNNSMLLESSEIDSKENVKSILMLKAALKIECHGRTVEIKALSENGKNAFFHLQNIIEENRHLILESNSNDRARIRYKDAKQALDEDSRLKSSSPIDILRVIKNSFKLENNNPYSLFLCGVFAFDFIANFEELPSVEAGNNSCPDFVFYLAESLLVIDHLSNQKRLIANHFSGNNQQAHLFELSRNMEKIEQLVRDSQSNLAAEDTAFSSNNSQSGQSDLQVDLSDSEYQQIVRDLKQNIIHGDVFQVVPSRSFSLPCPAPLESYRQLKRNNPSPYLFFMQDENFTLFGASPESALKYCADDNRVELYPIAGTRPRGKTDRGEIDKDLDARIEAELKLDQKEVAEHMMLVDLARNDIARIAESGTTHVSKLLAVDRYSQVMHLVSCVQGQLKRDLDALHAYQACMNMGTLTGAPKIRATQLIREKEKTRRGSYGGAVGYLNGRGDMDSCIVIRSAFCRNGIAYVQAGAGIVYDSDPVSEANETSNKAQAVINAIQRANRMLNTGISA